MSIWDLLIIGLCANATVWLWLTIQAVDTDFRDQQRERERQEARKHGIYL